MANKKNKKDSANIKYVEETMGEIFDIVEKLSVTDYDKHDFSTPPEKWHSEKILFLINKNIHELNLRGKNPPSIYAKHLGLICCLHNIGVSSINLTHSFSPTYLGYTHEYFSWKFESSKVTDAEKKDIEVKDKLQQIILKEKIPMFIAENFENMVTRTISIFEQKEHISRLFREMYTGLKKATKISDSNISIEKKVVDVILLIIPFVLYDFERLSLKRKNNSLENEYISNLAWSENGVNTTLKINALFKRPTVKISKTSSIETLPAIENIVN